MKLQRSVIGMWMAIFAIVGALAFTVSASAGQPEMITICHAAGREGTTQYVTLTLPYPAVYGQAGHFYENGTPRAGHEQDYLGACITPSATPTNTEVPSGTPTNTAVPTDSPTPTPTNTDVPDETPTSTRVEPSATPVTPSATPTDEQRPSPTPGCDPEFAPCEPTPTPKPRDCPQDPCGWLWHLVGPDGQTAWFASYSLRSGMDPNEGPSWYPPATESQLRCLGWVSVGNLPGRPLSQQDAQALTSCMGGVCQPPGR